MKVLIIGAGLAGPSLALALARQSIHSTIYERRPASTDIGGVLMLAPNAIRVIRKVIGIEDDIRPLGFTFTQIEMHAGGSGAMEKLGGLRVEKDVESLTIKRPVLHDKLLELCRGNEFVKIEFGKSLIGVEEDDEGVTALFEDGSQARGKL
jgi:2-polyprenyl-6-methoxyphenol hydroxylase-like FAD-dependent oxidoreductase